MKDKAASDSFDRPLAPGTARVAGGGAMLERLGVRFFRCEAGWIDFALDALAPEWRTRCTHLNDPFVDMLRWLGEIAAGEGAARWEVAEEGFATQFVYLPPNCNSLGESCGVLVQTGSNESALFYTWACATAPAHDPGRVRCDAFDGGAALQRNRAAALVFVAVRRSRRRSAPEKPGKMQPLMRGSEHGFTS